MGNFWWQKLICTFRALPVTVVHIHDLPGLWNPARQTLIFCNFSRLPLCNISSLLCCSGGDDVFLPLFLVSDLCTSGCRQNNLLAKIPIGWRATQEGSRTIEGQFVSHVFDLFSPKIGSDKDSTHFLSARIFHQMEQSNFFPELGWVFSITFTTFENLLVERTVPIHFPPERPCITSRGMGAVIFRTSR